MVSKAGETEALFGRTDKAGAFFTQLKTWTFSAIIFNPELKFEIIGETELWFWE